MVAIFPGIAIALAVLGLWPPLLLVSAHIWKDVPMLGAFA